MREKDTVDELIFNTDSTRTLLLMGLMARGGMRVDEVLNLRAQDIDDRKIHKWKRYALVLTNQPFGKKE